MDEKHRNIIKTNHVELISKTDLNRLLPGLMEADIFPEPLMESYTVSNNSQREIKRKLYLDLPKRGPHAFTKFIEVLRQTGHTELVALLNPPENGNTITSSTNSTTHSVNTEPQGGHTRLLQLAKPEYSSINIEKLEQISSASPSPKIEFRINVSTEPLNIAVKKAEEFCITKKSKVLPYPMYSKKRGILFLINNVKFHDEKHGFRKAADIDQKNIVELFRQCGFDVTNQHENLTLREMKQKIQAFSDETNRALDGVDCCVVIVMSHGGDMTYSSTVVSVDDYELPTEWIVDQFNSTNCILLQSKPKIFIFQTCRGSIWDYGTTPTLPNLPKLRVEVDGGIGVKRKIRTGDDMLIGYSTIPGYVSHRDIELGSWYIQTICKVFMEHAHDTHVEEMLRMVDSEIRDLVSEMYSMQTCSYENRGFRPCYLHPGLYKDQ